MSLARWSEYKWPKWVPQNVREQIEDFWSNSIGRDYHRWEESAAAYYNSHPPLGAKVKVDMKSWGRSGRRFLIGRWVPSWNNMAYIVLCDGTAEVVSTCDIPDGEREKWKARQHRLTRHCAKRKKY